jgi:O-antigen/teichoic acid export membrane protein
VVQDGEASDKKLSTLFWVSAAIGAIISLTLAGLSFFVDRWIAHADAGSFMLWLSICPFVVSLGLVQDGALRKDLAIKELAIRTATSTCLAGAIAITLCYGGFGGWALVWFTVANVSISTVTIFLLCPWKPSFTFDKQHFLQIKGVLLSLAGRYMISAAAVPAVQLLVSVRLGVAAGGVYQLAHRVYSLVDTVAVLPLRFLALPLFAQVQASDDRLRQRIAKMLGVGGIVAFPVYFGLCALSGDLLPLVFGERNGRPVVIVVRILCWCGVASVIVGLVNHALTSRGRASTVFKRSVLTVAIAIALCLPASSYSLEWVVIAYSAAYGIVGLGLALVLLKRHMGLPVGQVGKELLRPLLAALSMSGILLALSWRWGPELLLLKVLCLTALGALFYLGILFVFAKSQLVGILDVATGRAGKRTKGKE